MNQKQRLILRALLVKPLSAIHSESCFNTKMLIYHSKLPPFCSTDSRDKCNSRLIVECNLDSSCISRLKQTRLKKTYGQAANSISCSREERRKPYAAERYVLPCKQHTFAMMSWRVYCVNNPMLPNLRWPQRHIQLMRSASATWCRTSS